MRWILYPPLWLLLNIGLGLWDIVRLQMPTYLPFRDLVGMGEEGRREIKRTSCNCPPLRFLFADHLPTCPQARK